MKQKLLIAALASTFILSAQAADPIAPADMKTDAAAKPIAVVNGVALPAIYGNFVRQSRVSRGAAPESVTDEAIRDALVSLELMAQEAQRKGLDKGPTVLAAIEFQRKELLSQAALEDFIRSHPVAEETIQQEYDHAKAKAGNTEYKARHILVDSEKEAKDIIAKLATGKKVKFEDLAKKQSKDSSAANGGDLGWMLPANLVPEFADAMAKLKKGEISKTPVQTKYGWHVIQLDDSRKLDFPSYEKLKPRIANQLQQQQLRKYIQELRATAKLD